MLGLVQHISIKDTAMPAATAQCHTTSTLTLLKYGFKNFGRFLFPCSRLLRKWASHGYSDGGNRISMLSSLSFCSAISKMVWHIPEECVYQKLASTTVTNYHDQMWHQNGLAKANDKQSIWSLGPTLIKHLPYDSITAWWQNSILIFLAPSCCQIMFDIFYTFL